MATPPQDRPPDPGLLPHIGVDEDVPRHPGDSGGFRFLLMAMVSIAAAVAAYGLDVPWPLVCGLVLAWIVDALLLVHRRSSARSSGGSSS